MKLICSNMVWAGLSLAVCAHGAAIAADKLPSVPSNLDFEEGTKYWRVPKPKWRVEDGAGRGGSKGVEFVLQQTAQARGGPDELEALSDEELNRRLADAARAIEEALKA